MACLLQVAQDEGQDQDHCHDDEAAFTGIGVVAVAFFEGAILVEVVGEFFGGFVGGEHENSLKS
ncbi:MAG: hypothetical protein K0B14_19875 [Anaerolineaceae bacterium]|nr:hypothetical protein [Anaerolineaceae bacterium]